MRSVLAQKTRAGEISPVAAVAILQRFRGDIRRRRFRVVSLGTRHYELAEHLVDVYGLSNGLRALDSLHLAVALDLQQNRRIDSIIAATSSLPGRTDGTASRNQPGNGNSVGTVPEIREPEAPQMIM